MLQCTGHSWLTACERGDSLLNLHKQLPISEQNSCCPFAINLAEPHEKRLPFVSCLAGGAVAVFANLDLFGVGSSQDD